jgi:hypothetical protein
MKEGFVLWRAQLGHEYREEKQGDEVFEIEAAYSPARMKPLPDKAYDGRANPKGIPCLYLATRKETALSEVRPWIGSYVSVGQFKILRDVELIDCSREHKDFPLHLVLQELEEQESEPAESKRLSGRTLTGHSQSL